MPRCRWLLLGLVLLGPGPRAQELPPEIQALDRAFQKAIARTDKCVVSILVARDETYDQFEAKKARAPGELGRFDAVALLAKIPASDTAPRRRIADLDLTAPTYIPEATATGLILDKAGLILTPGHAVSRAKKLYVKLPGGKGSFADIHALDPRSDLAVLRLLDPPAGLQAARLGDGGAVRKGQLVLLLANPFAAAFRAPSPTAAWGMVANVRRKLPGPLNETDRALLTLHHYGTLLQIGQPRSGSDVVPLNLTTSGAVVLDLAGEVVAMTTAQAAVLGGDTPGGFAIPFDEGIRRIIEVLRKGEEVEYGFLGVSVQTVGFGGRGAEVGSVSDGSPARHAGLKMRDLVVRIDGQPVHDADDLFLLVGTKLAGTAVKIEYVRAGRLEQPVVVKLAKFLVQTPGGIVSRRPAPQAGLRVDWTSLLSQRVQIGPRAPIPTGVLIREVIPGSAAARANLQVDDVISRVGGIPVRTPEEFYRAMAAGKGAVELTLEGKEPVTLTR